MKTFQLRNGDLTLGVGGFAMVSGRDKILQDLGAMVREEIGTDRFHPRWGTVLDQYIGMEINKESETYIKSEISRLIQNYVVMQTQQIESDLAAGRKPRFAPEEIIKAIDKIEVQQFYDKLNVRVSVVTATEETVEILRTVEA